MLHIAAHQVFNCNPSLLLPNYVGIAIGIMGPCWDCDVPYFIISASFVSIEAIIFLIGLFVLFQRLG